MQTSTTQDAIVLSAARWFWWIAGLSLVNTVLFHAGSDTNFAIGLGLTTLTNVLFAQQIAVSIAIAAVTIGFYFFVGLMAQRERLWAFYLGLGVYALDALIYVRFEDWMPVAFHALACFYIGKGAMRLREQQGGGKPDAAQA